MSDNFEMLADVDVSAHDAPALCERILHRFREIGLITGDATSECVLGGTGYWPGPALDVLYVREEREGKFWTWRTCGVQPCVGRGFNFWAIGPVADGFTCRSCRTCFLPWDEAFSPVLGNALNEWLDDSGPAMLACPQCGNTEPVAEWNCTPPLGFGNLGFKFWNWPRLDRAAWKLDIAQLLRELTGHTIVRTYGHI